MYVPVPFSRWDYSLTLQAGGLGSLVGGSLLCKSTLKMSQWKNFNYPNHPKKIFEVFLKNLQKGKSFLRNDIHLSARWREELEGNNKSYSGVDFRILGFCIVIVCFILM